MAAVAETSALTMVPSVISADSMVWASSETLVLSRPSDRVPEEILEALRLVRLAPLPCRPTTVTVSATVSTSTKLLPRTSWILKAVVEFVAFLNSGEPFSRGTLVLKRASPSVPLAILAALRLVRLIPDSTGSRPALVNWTSCEAPLKVLPWMVTSLGRLIRLTSPVRVEARVTVVPVLQPPEVQTITSLIFSPVLFNDVCPLEASSVPLDCTSPVTCKTDVPGPAIICPTVKVLPLATTVSKLRLKMPSSSVKDSSVKVEATGVDLDG